VTIPRNLLGMPHNPFCIHNCWKRWSASTADSQHAIPAVSFRVLRTHGSLPLVADTVLGCRARTGRRNMKEMATVSATAGSREHGNRRVGDGLILSACIRAADHPRKNDLSRLTISGGWIRPGSTARCCFCHSMDVVCNLCLARPAAAASLPQSESIQRTGGTRKRHRAIRCWVSGSTNY
jgi:hypothetical protein